MSRVFAGALSGFLFFGFQLGHAAAADIVDVRAFAATSNMPSSGDTADDSCLWLCPDDARRSVIIGTNKSDHDTGGLYVFHLDGRAHGGRAWRSGENLFGEGSKLNNVDVRYGFRAGSERWDLVCASNRSDRSIDIFRVRTTREGDFDSLQEVGQIPIGDGFKGGDKAPYGLGMYHSRRSDRHFVFVSDYSNRMAQYELVFAADAEHDRSVLARRHDDDGSPWKVVDGDCPVEGIVCDDLLEVVYFSSEDRGLFRVDLRDDLFEPESRIRIAKVDTRANGDRPLCADLEGLALYRAENGGGYLIASSQGQDLKDHTYSSTYAVFDRRFEVGEANRYLGSFRVIEGDATDAVQYTDGIHVTSADLGGALSHGLLIAHDGSGSDPSNHKLVAWREIERAFDGRIASDRPEPERAPTHPPPRHLKPVLQMGRPGATADKPQSKLWWARGHWWAWLPHGAAEAGIGGRIWQRAKTGHWQIVDHLSAFASQLPGRADVVADESRVEAVLVDGKRIAVVRLYWNDERSRWLPATSPLVWSEAHAVETATIARADAADANLWISYPAQRGKDRSVVVRRLDPALSGERVDETILAEGLGLDEICVVFAYRESVAVAWSDQKNETLWWRRHEPASDAWSKREPIASGSRTADDHLSIAMPPGASAGRLLLATKTERDTDGELNLCLRVHGREGWTSTHFARKESSSRRDPTRPIVLWLGKPACVYSEPDGLWLQQFTEDGASTDGPARHLATATARLNDPTKPRRAADDGTLLILASDDQGAVYELELE